MYIRQIALIMKRLRGELTLEALRRGVQESALSESLKELAGLRLEFAEEYIDDTYRLTEILRPGRLVIVDLRDEFIDKDEALGLFVVLLQMFADTTYQGRRFNKLVVFDEAHKYIGSPDLVAGLIEVVREMRPQRYEHSGSVSGPAVGSHFAYRTVHADHPAQIQFSGVAETHPEGKLGSRRTHSRQARFPESGRSIRLE